MGTVDPVLETMPEDDDIDRTCYIEGCDRPGEIPRKLRGGDDIGPIDPDADPFTRHYICHYHHRLYLGIKVGIVAILIFIALLAFFNI